MHLHNHRISVDNRLRVRVCRCVYTAGTHRWTGRHRDRRLIERGVARNGSRAMNQCRTAKQMETAVMIRMSYSDVMVIIILATVRSEVRIACLW